MVRLRRWLRYRAALMLAMRAEVGGGRWLTRQGAAELAERERRFAGIYRRP